MKNRSSRYRRAGVHPAATAASVKSYGDIKVTLVRKNSSVMVPCGIPYIFGTLKDPAKTAYPIQC